MDKRRIAVIEDEATIAASVAARLRAEGFEVETAGDGVAGLELCRRFAPDLVETLPELGLELPFSESADFTGISPENPFIGAGVHAADIEVDEEGTVAAAATALFFVTSGPPQPDAVVRADRPFLYLIRERKTGSVLFLGRVTDPSA